jgi:hypothetical protein
MWFRSAHKKCVNRFFFIARINVDLIAKSLALFSTKMQKKKTNFAQSDDDWFEKKVGKQQQRHQAHLTQKRAI